MYKTIRRFLIWNSKEFVYLNLAKTKEIKLTSETATKPINYILGGNTNE
ncbi:hypothetical protein HOU39_gp157 [Lactobacillus phage Iacchus]|uniref:Uncharacterized protein n=2 Tax=Harbinvirus TaxID=2732970 RepID=A0A3Q8HXY2_9CAUD|nr:hypothetical protein HOU39_gp157 [Lactobacillus phage Iacchus]YP_009814548.1 hypothetical protein HOU40_gp161 [Lactobacillus phage Bromius]AYH92051.1 hypothetical protein [Lactobacillus phage Iacchus]AYH92223.1 hypothetical protein [Lactobacillus phage Dionysus]AYH92397.1 hypothetical protein [Lactobacillus phage Bromius]